MNKQIYNKRIIIRDSFIIYQPLTYINKYSQYDRVVKKYMKNNLVDSVLFT